MTRVLITGAAGFVGHHVVDHFLRETKWELVILDGLTYAGNLNRIASLPSYQLNKERLSYVYHNLRSPINDLVARSIGHDIEYIFHLAANSSVEYTLRYPEISVMDNVMGTLNVLEYARKLESLELMNYFSTDEVYGPVKNPGDGFDEEAPHKPSNPYSAGKAAGEDYAYAWHVTYGLPVYITNSMNIFGFNQHPEKFIPTVIRHVMAGTPVPIYSSGGGKQAGSRYWIYAYDVAEALLFLNSRALVGQKYHIRGEWVDNLVMAKTIAYILNRPLNYEMYDFHSSRPGHDLHYGLTDTKMHKMGWKLKYGVTEGLRAIIPSYI